MEGGVQCPWHGMFHITSHLSSWVRAATATGSSLRNCRGCAKVVMRRSWAGELCVPPPSPRAHSCSNTPWREAKEFSYLGLPYLHRQLGAESRSGMESARVQPWPAALWHRGVGAAPLPRQWLLLFVCQENNPIYVTPCEAFRGMNIQLFLQIGSSVTCGD